MAKHYFDIFKLRQYREGWIIEVDIARPGNAPRYRHTSADSKRAVIAAEKNMQLAKDKVIYPTLDKAVEAIKDLCCPEANDE